MNPGPEAFVSGTLNKFEPSLTMQLCTVILSLAVETGSYLLYPSGKYLIYQISNENLNEDKFHFTCKLGGGGGGGGHSGNTLTSHL